MQQKSVNLSMKVFRQSKFFLLLILMLYYPFQVAAQIFRGEPPADWVKVEGTSTVTLPLEESIDKDELMNIARQEAVEKKFGTSIIYGNFMKSYEGEMDHYDHYLDLTSQFPQGIWRADITTPVFKSVKSEILKKSIFGKLRKKVDATRWFCTVKGYAQPIKQIMPQFEFQILNGKKQCIVEQRMQDGQPRLIVGGDSVFHQGDLFITRFRCSRSGHLALFMDNGENAFRMLPYSAFDTADDVEIESGKWYTFFDYNSVSEEEREVVDELELITDRQYDAIRVYYLFSETPFTRDFFFSMTTDTGNVIPEGYSQLPSVTSVQFAKWLQQNKIRKADLQISVVDLVIDNTNNK